MSENYNIKYIPTHAMSNKNKYLEEYYTGVDTDIYINNIKCDYINSIQYSLQEQLLPIYGYNSYTYDDVAIGNRIVVGSIKVPITNYSTFIKELNSASNQTRNTSSYSNDITPSWVKKSDITIPISAYENIVSDLYNKGIPVTMTNIMSSSISTHVSDNGSGVTNSATDNSSIDSSSEYTSKKPKYDRSDNTFFNTIYSDTEVEDEHKNKNTIRKNHMTIIIQISETHKKKLEDVIFRGVDTTYDSEGEPLFEILQFIARDLIEDEIEDTESSTNTSGSGSSNTEMQL